MRNFSYKTFVLGFLAGAVLTGIAFGTYIFLFMENEGDGGNIVGREEGVTAIVDKTGTLEYTNPRYGFSLEFPRELAVGRSQEGNATETIVFQKPGDQLGFQIFITPYVGETITRERMQQDISGGEISEPREVVIGDGIRALVFWSEHPAVGRMREVWFIHDGMLYEVSTYEEQDEWLAGILETWSFPDNNKQ